MLAAATIKIAEDKCSTILLTWPRAAVNYDAAKITLSNLKLDW